MGLLGRTNAPLRVLYREPSPLRPSIEPIPLVLTIEPRLHVHTLEHLLRIPSWKLRTNHRIFPRHRPCLAYHPAARRYMRTPNMITTKIVRHFTPKDPLRSRPSVIGPRLQRPSVRLRPRPSAHRRQLPFAHLHAQHQTVVYLQAPTSNRQVRTTRCKMTKMTSLGAWKHS